jgi:hypothetical protein
MDLPESGLSRLASPGRDEPVDDGSPRQRLDPADARLWRAHRPPMSTHDPNPSVGNGCFEATSIVIGRRKGSRCF